MATLRKEVKYTSRPDVSAYRVALMLTHLTHVLIILTSKRKGMGGGLLMAYA